MPTLAGKDILVKIADPDHAGQFITIGGMRSRTLAFAQRSVDGTAADSPEGWRELIAGAGQKEATITGNGVFRDSASDRLIRACFFAQTAAQFQLIMPDFGEISGPFIISALEYGGAFDGEANFSMTLSSAGALTFAVLS